VRVHITVNISQEQQTRTRSLNSIVLFIIQPLRHPKVPHILHLIYVEYKAMVDIGLVFKVHVNCTFSPFLLHLTPPCAAHCRASTHPPLIDAHTLTLCLRCPACLTHLTCFSCRVGQPCAMCNVQHTLKERAHMPGRSTASTAYTLLQLFPGWRTPDVFDACNVQDWSLVSHVRHTLKERARLLGSNTESVQGQCDALVQEAQQERRAVSWPGLLR